MFLSLFDERKAAEAVAYLLAKAGGSLEVLKLMKLVYLCERASYEKYGEPMIGDAPYALEHGPVLRNTYNLAKADTSAPPAWSHLIAPRVDKFVRLKAPEAFDSSALLDVSDADLALIDEVWDSFGHKTASQLRAYTHDHLAEYEEPPPGHSRPIAPTILLQAIGYSASGAREHLKDLQAAARAKDALTQAGA